MKVISVFTCAALSVVAVSAHATAPGFYGQLHGELSFADDKDLDINGANAGDVAFDVEYAAGLALGYRPETSGFFGNTRWELEGTYRELDFDDISNPALAPGGFGGSVESYVFMANTYYDFYNSSNWTPYVGGGLGYANHQFDSITIQTDDDDGVFAYQAMAGVAYAIEPYNNVDVGLGYRYFGSDDISVRSSTGNNVEMDYDSHNIEAFLRIGF